MKTLYRLLLAGIVFVTPTAAIAVDNMAYYTDFLGQRWNIV